METASDFGPDYYHASARRKKGVEDEDDILYGSSEIGEKDLEEQKKINPDGSTGNKGNQNDQDEFEEEEEDLPIVLNTEGATLPSRKPFQPRGNFNMNLQRQNNATQNLGPSSASQNPVNVFHSGQFGALPLPQQQQIQSLMSIAQKQQGKESGFEVDIDSLEEKPWRKPGADITDYFNYGFNEETWKAYIGKQVQMRLESSMQNKIKVYSTHDESGFAAPKPMTISTTEVLAEMNNSAPMNSAPRRSQARRTAGPIPTVDFSRGGEATDTANRGRPSEGVVRVMEQESYIASFPSQQMPIPPRPRVGGPIPPSSSIPSLPRPGSRPSSSSREPERRDSRESERRDDRDRRGDDRSSRDRRDSDRHSSSSRDRDDRDRYSSRDRDDRREDDDRKRRK